MEKVNAIMFFREKERRKNEESRTESLDLEGDDGPSFSFYLQGLACGNEIGNVEMGGISTAKILSKEPSPLHNSL